MGVVALHRIADGAEPAWAELPGVYRELRINSARVVLLVSTTAFVLTTGMALGAAGTPLLNAAVLETGLTADDAGVLSAVGLAVMITGAALVTFGLVVGG